MGSNPTLSAIESRDAETFRSPRETIRKNTRFCGVLGDRLRASEPETEGSRLNSRRGSRLSLLPCSAVPIRWSSGRDSGAHLWLPGSRSAAAFRVRRLGALPAFLSRTQAASVAPPSPAADRHPSSALVSRAQRVGSRRECSRRCRARGKQAGSSWPHNDG